MRDRHLDEHTLRSYLDDELGWGRAALCAAHLRRCARCRDALEEQRQLDHRAAGLLARLAFPTDLEAGWRRVRPARGARPYLRGAWALGALGLGLTLGAVLPRAFAGGDRAGGPIRDVCCWNLDGGPQGDDGVLTVSAAGEAVACVVLYDDVDGSHSFSDGDVVRFASASAPCPDPAGAHATPSTRPGAGATQLGGLPLAVR